MKLRKGLSRTLKAEDTDRLLFEPRGGTLYSLIVTTDSKETRLTLRTNESDLDLPSPENLNTILGEATSIEGAIFDNIVYNTSSDIYTQRSFSREKADYQSIEIYLHNPTSSEVTYSFQIFYEEA